MLDKQIQIYTVDTASFYSNEEKRLHMLNQKLRSERNVLINNDKNDEKRNNELIALKNKKASEVKDRLKKLLSNKVEHNIATNGRDHIRELRSHELSDKNIISVFDSYFTRTIGAKQDELCEDFMVIQVYYFDIIKDLIYHGFTYKGEKYIYFTSSAGQIRTKKCVFVKESVWQKHEKSLMCGLTVDKINAKGGNNSNKHLAYLALANSATDVWEEFDIDKTIVIDDFETDVWGTYDFVDETDYSINRKTGNVFVPHTDGAGMMLPCMGKNRMVRLPWIKGLLGVFDFRKFIEVHNCSPVIKDIYGKEHNVIDEDIQIIFTKSQFKLWNYYDSWQEYKDNYKKYNCTAGHTNIEEEHIKNATINYQMLQSLTDITEDEIYEIAKESINKLNNIYSSKENIMNMFGVSPYNTNKTPFQDAIVLYPNIINDEYAKTHLRSIKNSMIKKYKSGKLNVYGKYTFLLPDFYAACEHWFLGEENPKGLLKDKEVFCWLFKESSKLDCLRSPHLFMEHAVRENVACSFRGNKKNNIRYPEYEERQSAVREWFQTDAIYTSCHDLISKVLQFDVDGDKSLVVADETLIEVAERNIDKFDIVPLYYNMKKAKSTPLNSKVICDGLDAAFYSANIGMYSNHISKIWNSNIFISGTLEEQKEAIDVIKLFCMENNFVIDYAKTLYQTNRTKEANKTMKEFTQEPLPHFFKYAKDKKDSQICKLNNSLVNKLESIIPNPRMNFKKLGIGDIDYKLMMNNQDIEFDFAFTDNGRLIKEESDPLIVEYCEFNKEYYLALDNALCPEKDNGTDSYAKTRIKYEKISNDVKSALSQFGYSDEEIADILIKYLYGIKNSNNKTALWLCYGDIIVENLKNNLKYRDDAIRCIDCGKWIKVDVFDSATVRCTTCQRDHEKKTDREWRREQRGGFTDVRQSVDMFKDGSIVASFNSVEECCEYMHNTVCKKVKSVKSIRSNIDKSIRIGKPYKGYLFIKK